MLIMKKPLHILFGTFLRLIVIQAEVFKVPNYSWYKIEPLHEPVCKDEQSKIRSKEILSYLDQTVDPCSNFYQYACGGWQKEHPIPPSWTMWNLEAEYIMKLYLHLREQLEKPVTQKDSLDVKRAKKHYQICSLLPSLGKLDVDRIKEMISKAGPWPMLTINKNKETTWNWINIHYYYFKTTSDAGLFDVDINGDPQDFYKPIFELKALDSPFGLILEDGKWKTDWIQNNYVFLMQLVLKVATSTFSEANKKSLLQSIKDVYTFRRKLKEAASTGIEDEDDYHPVTLNKFQHWFDSTMTMQDNRKVITNIDWLKMLNSLFQKSGESVLSHKTRVNLKHKDFFLALIKLLSTTPAEIIANHLHLYFVERHLLLDTDLSYRASKVVTTKDGVNIGSIRILDERWQRCISKSNVNQSIDAAYISKVITEKIQKDIPAISDTIRKIVIMHVNDSTWLDNESKRKALVRIENVKIVIGVPEVHLSIENKNAMMIHFGGMQTFYSVDTNRIFLGPSYLESPVYTEDLPYVINYAAIGSVIAHEFYHMFDKIGVTYNIYPKESRKTLFSPKILNTYEKKAECIIDQYSRRLKGPQDLAPTLQSDGKRTYNENVADIMSIKTSYGAFKKRLLAEKRSCPILPDLKDFNCEKLFFISYAITFCANIPKWKLVRQLQTSKHSIPELRVNMPVANMPEFSEAFNCKKNSYENSINRCFLWD